LAPYHHGSFSPASSLFPSHLRSVFRFRLTMARVPFSFWVAPSWSVCCVGSPVLASPCPSVAFDSDPRRILSPVVGCSAVWCFGVWVLLFEGGFGRGRRRRGSVLVLQRSSVWVVLGFRV
jgi:hypothetical protein